MAVTEVKKEPIEHMIPTDYEETVLNTINKPPASKVSILFGFMEKLSCSYII